MRKSRLKSGEPFLGIKIEHFVTATDFARALADYYWMHSVAFDPYLKKSKAMQILKSSLFNKGLSGEIYDGQFDGASEEAFDAWNIPYEAAKEWVIKNYPYLKHKEVGNET